jgi:DNA-binding NarL/FixJ family response regulator
VALRCLIVDDNAHFLDAARNLLERQGMTVVGLAATGADAALRAAELEPDVALVDVSLGAESGFDVARTLCAGLEGRGCPVILMSAHDESDFADLLEDTPALGFLSKSEVSRGTIDDLLSARRGT